MTEEAMMEGHYKEVCGMRVLMLLRIHPYPPSPVMQSIFRKIS